MTSSPFYRQSEIVNPQIAISIDLFLTVYLCAPPVLWREFVVVCVLCMCVFRGMCKICYTVLKVDLINYVTSLSAEALL